MSTPLRDVLHQVNRVVHNNDDIFSEDAVMTEVLEMMDEQNKQFEALQKRKKTEMFGLPSDPRFYNSSQTKVWVNQSLVDFDVPDDNIADTVSRLESLDLKPGLTGDSLAKWNIEQYQQVFGTNHGDILHNRFKKWVDIDDHHKRSLCDLKQHQDPIIDMPPLPPACTEEEKQILIARGVDTNAIKYFADNHSKPSSVPKSQQYDQIVPSPTQFNNPYPFDPYHAYMCSSPTLSGHNSVFPMHNYEHDNPPLYEDAISWIRKPPRPNSVGSTSDNSEGSVDLKPHPWHQHGNVLPDISQILTHRHQPPQIVQNKDMPVDMVKRKPEKRPRGRPKKPKIEKPKRKQPILYQFILMHLKNPESRPYVQWVDKSEGVFRFHSAQKDNFAKMWGQYKRNREPMSYQNMARALRNYTKGKRKIMERVKKKLHYKFVAGVPT
ncbi:uncharacterized protein [Amphiura filiformis]|uniref:uncharacterized protein n=1 Tax=Amphiura filiformis TaxID=82378 RepID=UPI003B218ECF